VDTIIYEDELRHYGVLGMKWGVKRAQYKAARNATLRNKAVKYDKKSAKLTKKSEKVHAEQDLEERNRKAVKAAKYKSKAASVTKQAQKTEDSVKRAKLERKSEKLKYKSAKLQIDADRLSKTKGYSAKAMKYSIKSDIVAKRAAKARKKIANNNYYIELMKAKASDLSASEKNGDYAFVKELYDIKG
jgi:hypothetical protein